MNEKMYMISEAELKDLLTGYFNWAAVEEGGVDNWEWCGASIGDFIRRFNQELGMDEDHSFETIEEIAEHELFSYDEVI